MANQNIGKVSLVNLPLNGGIQSDGSFPLTAKQEVENIFNSGQSYPVEETPYLNYSISGQCILALPTYEHTNSSYIPLDSTGSFWRFPLTYIRSFTNHSPLDVGLFQTNSVNEGGITSFTYKGLNPLHTIISGTIVIQRCVASTLTSHKFRSVLYLNGESLPNIELGQSLGRQYLGFSAASLSPQPAQLISSEYSTEIVDGAISPTSGYWVQEVIAVNQDVVFYPNATYSLALLSTAYGTGAEAIQSHSIRCVSGGLSFNFDATNLVRSKFSKFIEE